MPDFPVTLVMNRSPRLVLALVVFGVTACFSASVTYAAQVSIPASTYLLMLQREHQMKREEIKGIGMVFTSQVEKIKEAETFTYRVYARGCGKVTLPRQPQTDSLKQGDRVKFKFSRSGECDIAGWEKF